MAIIKAVNVSILYLTGDFKDIGLKEYVMRHLKHNYHVTKFWADRNINFSLDRGDMLGIIGTNGAGKSTLLKAVSGIMVPTEGHMEIHGSIAALLELASGFDPELTGRENIYLNGAVLGYSKEFLDEQFDHIVEFSEIGDFINIPLKNYSSGMVSRIAFSIATAVKPDILIADEILSVGDFLFQEKCLNRIHSMMSEGTTVLFVSHSIEQVRQICDRAMWIEKGNLKLIGEVNTVCDAYSELR